MAFAYARVPRIKTPSPKPLGNRPRRPGGEASEAWLAYGLGDAVLLRKMIAEGEASEERKRLENAKLDALISCASPPAAAGKPAGLFWRSPRWWLRPLRRCLLPPRVWDATEAARKALSCAYRTGQRWRI